MSEKKITLTREIEINKITLEEDAIAHIEMRKESILLVKRKSNKYSTFKKQVWLSDLIENYIGPSIYLDLDEKNNLIRIEILED